MREACARAARALMALCLLMKGLFSTPRSSQDVERTSGPNLSTAFGRTALPERWLRAGRRERARACQRGGQTGRQAGWSVGRGIRHGSDM